MQIEERHEVRIETEQPTEETRKRKRGAAKAGTEQRNEKSKRFCFR